jgi:putative transposase
MGIARSTYYDTPEAKRDDTALVEAMAAICAEFEGKRTATGACSG